MRLNSGAARCALLLGLSLCVAPLTGRAIKALVSFEDQVKGATTIFAGTVSRVDSMAVESLKVSLRYHFVDVTFVKGGALEHEVEAGVVATCRDILVSDGAGTRYRCGSWFPYPSLAVGSRYVVLGHGEAILDYVAIVDYVWDGEVFPVEADSAGVRVIAGTRTPERRFLDDIRLILNRPAPEPVPADD